MFVRTVPFFSSVRYPEKHMVLAAFGLGWLSALGLAAVAERVRPSWRGPVLAAFAAAIFLDRQGAAERLLPAWPPSVLTTPPRVLAPVLPGARDDQPLRLFAESSYTTSSDRPGPIVEAERQLLDLASPRYGSLFGVSYPFEPDYDVSLPVQALEWTILMEKAVPSGSDVPRRAALAAGARGILGTRPGPYGKRVPELRLFRDPVEPYRFVPRVVRDSEGRRLFRRYLEEGLPPGSAFVLDSAAGGGAELQRAQGRILRVSDRAAGLELEVDVGPPGGYLLLFRSLAATAKADVDGRPVRAEDACFGFTGLEVPPGRHLVRLRPETRWLKIAGLVSASTLALAVAVALLLRKRSSGQALVP